MNLKELFMNEKRTNDRINVGLKALFREGNSGAYNTRITNISMGGLFMVTSQLLNLGTEIVIDIDAENIGRIIGVSGHVVRNTRLGMAVEFINPDETGLDSLIKAEKFMAIKIKSSRKTNQRNTL
jgi:Tfp pilus assembly protein PilZ